MSTNTDDVLRDDAFDAFLDQVIAIGQGEDREDARDEDEEDDDGRGPALSDEEQALARQQARTLLASRQLAPGDMDALERLFRIWMWLDQPAQAIAALDAHQARLEADLSHNERLQAARSCALWRLDAAQSQPEQNASQHAAHLEAAADAISASAGARDPDPHRLISAWEHLLQRAGQGKQGEVYARCAREMHALNSQQAQRKNWRSYDDAALQLRLALAAEMGHNLASAEALATKASQTLAQPGPDQDVDEGDWLRLAPDMVRLAPGTLPLVNERAMAALGPNASRALKRDMAVKLARLRARSLWASGDQAGALAAAQQGRFLLSSDGDDDFSVLVMDWLLASGQEAEAAKIALDSTWHTRGASGPHAVQLAKHQLRGDSSCPGLWTLVLAAAAFEEDLSEADLRELGHADLATAKQHLLSHARALLPNHPAVDVLDAHALHAREQYAQALPKFERLLDAPELANQDSVYNLWLTRMRVLGAEAALNQRFVEVNSGNASYALGVTFSDADDILQALGLPEAQHAQFPKDALRDLSTRYYERAMLRFEGFFATGEGYVRDGDIHTYSMNCNNLAIRYRYHDQRYEDALGLHLKGLASSPFAEHKDGAMWCQYKLERYPEFIDAAEQLWHFSNDHGYGRHDPSDYFGSVGWALQRLNRSAEIEIWLDRLHQSRQHLDDDDPDLPDLLGCEAVLLDYLYPNKPKDCEVRMDAIAPLLTQIGDTWGLTRLGECFMSAQQPQKALQAYELAVSRHDPESDSEARLTSAREGVAAAQQALKKQKPFWRRWL